MAGQHPRPVGILRRAGHGGVVVAGAEQLFALQVVQHLFGAYGAGQLVIALTAGRGAQQLMEQYPLDLAKVAKRYTWPGRSAGREIAPLGAGVVAQVGMLDAGKLVRTQSVEEGAYGDRHLPAAARREGDIAGGPWPGLGRRRRRSRPGSVGHAEA